MAFPGYTAPQAFGIDAGVFLVGSTPIGATKGGMQFDPGVEIRHIEFDGLSTEIAGLHRITKYTATMSAKVLDLTDAALSRYFPGATSDGSSNNLFTMKDAREFWVTGDYLTNLKFVQQQSDGSAESFVITFARAMVKVNSITTEDNNETVVDVTFTAVLDVGATDLEAAPYTITKAAA